MQNRLLFLTSQYFYQPIQEALQRLSLSCESVVVPYNSIRDAVTVYQKYEADFDACVVSGRTVQRAIELSVPNIKKPIASFQVGSDDLHKSLFRLALEHQSLDFSRIALDYLIPMDRGCLVSDYLEIEDSVAFMDKIYQWMQPGDGTVRIDVDAYILEELCRMWQEGTFDLVLCQYSSIIPDLEKRGIPYRCPVISDTRLRNIIEKILLRLELIQQQNNYPAIIQIFPLHPEVAQPNQLQKLYDQVRSFNKAHFIDGVVQENPDCCTVITTLRILRSVTNDFQDCRLTAYLDEALGFRVYVGYGIGTTITHATNNVQIAAKEAKIVGKSFVVDSFGNLIGPLNSESRTAVSADFLPDASGIAKKCGMTTTSIRKLQAMLQSSGSDKITVPEMAQKLNTSIRNANRIMQSLCRGHVARPVYTQATSNSRGRPVQVYALELNMK